jgi:hypothetical protein
MLIKNSEITALFVAVICCYLIADFVSQIICEKIEARQTKMQSSLIKDLNYRDSELQALLKENLELKREVEFFEAKKSNKESTLKTITSDKSIIQCDKCYNEYDAENIQTSYLVQNIKQQYCNECFHRLTEKLNKEHHIKKSKSDSHFRYQFHQ